MEDKTKLDFIWNISLVCPWDCQFCCTDAVNVRRNGKTISVRESGLTQKRAIDMTVSDMPSSTLQRLKDRNIEPNIFDIALNNRQMQGLELDYEGKVKVLENISSSPVEIDFAGGDPLACYENFLVIQEASKRFGKNNISVTSTGASLGRYSLHEISSVIGKYEFTFDEPIEHLPTNRPQGYNKANLKIARKLSEANVRTKAQMPLHSGNMDLGKVSMVYQALHEAEIDELLLMRVFPVGRGIGTYSDFSPNRDAYIKVINEFRALERRYSYPRIRLQCALKHLDDITYNANPCDLMRTSYGINSRGDLLISAWATGPTGSPLDDAFILGNLRHSTFQSLLNSQKAKAYLAKLDMNWGHCKIFSFLFSESQDSESLFAKSDPLYL